MVPTLDEVVTPAALSLPTTGAMAVNIGTHLASLDHIKKIAPRREQLARVVRQLRDVETQDAR